MSTSSASSFDTHRGSSPGLPPTARALPSGRGGGETPVGYRERVSRAAHIALVVVTSPEHDAGGAGIRADELDLVDLRLNRLAVLGAQAGAVALRERLRLGT